ncbi:MAG: vWA domain-containing protein [Rhizobiaceae bacterium]
MHLATKLRNQAASFTSNQSGNIFMISALTIFAVISAAGVAVDYSRVSNAKFQMEQSLDAALLATGVEITNGEDDQAKLRAYFENFFLANLNNQTGFGEQFDISEFSVDPDTGEVSAEAGVTVEATLMRVLGYDDLEIRSSASAIFDRTDVEVAMMLDVTGSMGRNGKLDDLKLAAKDAIDILIPNSNTKGTRIGLVPYSWSVNAGHRQARMVTNGKSKRCVTERADEASTDASYKVAEIGADSRAVDDKLCPVNEIKPLTDKKGMLKREIGRFSAAGYTAGHLGVAWSYYVLSETWRDVWKEENDPAPYSKDVEKIAILMTDGEFNTFFQGTEGSRTPYGPHAEPSNTLALDLCADMKADKNGAPGITIYSIAFQAPSSAEATLRACANEDTETDIYYFSAGNGQELREAFRSIAASIQRLRISS